MSKIVGRRGFLKKSVAVSACAAALGAGFEEKTLLAQVAEGAERAEKQESAKDLPTGKIGDVEISRLIYGCNLMCWSSKISHVEFVDDLLKNYFTDEKIFETLEKCEEYGINTIVAQISDFQTDLKYDGRYEGRPAPRVLRLINKYRNERGGKIQFIGQCAPQPDSIEENIQVAIDLGAVGIHLMGERGDSWVEEGRIDLIAKVVDIVKRNGLIAGVAGHTLQPAMTCEKEGIDADFYSKTFHDAPGRRGNIYEREPEKVAAFMESVDKPWIAYKVLAAGAIHPRDGFEFAFKHGADFLLVGMLDFQLMEDVIIAKKVLAQADVTNRARPWRA
jgi:hypothetical protein